MTGDHVLRHDVAAGGVRFRVEGRGIVLAAREWARVMPMTPHGERADVGVLYGLIEELQEGGAIGTYADSTTVVIPCPMIAKLDHREVVGLGLPDPPPFTLWLDLQGVLSSAEFQLRVAWMHPTGRPIMGARRDGCILHVGAKTYTLLSPFFDILEAVDRLGEGSGDGLSETFAAMATLQELLPEEVKLGTGLRRLKVVRADSVSVVPFTRADGEPDFTVRLYRGPSQASVTDGRPEHVRALPDEPDGKFQQRFREFSDERRVFPVDGGWYVVVGARLARVLHALRKASDLDGPARREFLRRPTALVRSLLEDTIPEEQLDEVLVELSDYSDRVKGIGLWEAKVLPWIKKAAETWLPPEAMGIRIEDEFVEVAPADVADLLEAVKRARVEARASVDYKGTAIPATGATEEALGALMPCVTEGRPVEEDPRREVPGAPARTALLIKTNLESLEFKAAARSPRTAPGTVPGAVHTALLPHQQTALGWLQTHWCAGSRGALLADDMGLGKTLVGLAFMTWVSEQRQDGPMLLVAPTGLLRNWEDEYRKHLADPLPRICRAYGTGLATLRRTAGDRKPETSSGFPVLDPDRLRGADWVLVSYETLRDYQLSFGSLKWAMVIMDEAQKIKSPSALMTDAAKAVNAEFVVCMTGTPVENRMADLWSIVDTAQPGRLGGLKEFVAQYEVDPVAGAPALEALSADLTHAGEGRAPVMLRRLKADHLQGLPQREVHVLRESMPAAQAAAYSTVVGDARQRGGDRGVMLQLLHQMRSVCLHPYDRGAESDEEYLGASARLRALTRTLDVVARGGEKVLVFLESRRMQGVLAELLQRKYGLRTTPMIINGQVAGEVRKSRVDEFQREPGFDVLILSPRAGGVGLTLTEANHVVHLSRWWNPAVEDQCSDRVYRIGQERTVHLYYPLAIHPIYGDHSFDVSLDRLLARKRTLSARVLAPVGEWGGDMDEMVRGILPDEHATEDPLAKVDAMESVAFEEWVVGCLKERGYRVWRTPRTGSPGPDGVAASLGDSGTWLVRCKQASRDEDVEREVVKDVVKALKHHPEAQHGMVVTNARSFSRAASEEALKRSVLLYGREDLREWLLRLGEHIHT